MSSQIREISVTAVGIIMTIKKNINEFTKFVSSLIKGKIVKFDNHGMNTFRVVNMRKNMFIDITEFQNKSDGLI